MRTSSPSRAALIEQPALAENPGRRAAAAVDAAGVRAAHQPASARRVVARRRRPRSLHSRQRPQARTQGKFLLKQNVLAYCAHWEAVLSRQDAEELRAIKPLLAEVKANRDEAAPGSRRLARAGRAGFSRISGAPGGNAS
jgi:hypothetical protein